MDREQLQNLKNRYDIIGNDPELGRALEVACAVAPTDLTVLVLGESGVGKENIPKIIHNNSLRKGGKYFAVNCGAIPEGTIDSELFGHEKGAYTGAAEMRKGYFEEADGGTLFLDEIGELPLASQAKLLRVLQDGEFIRMGSSKPLKTDVRVIAATNIDLAWAVQKGKFRSDLYYRLNAVTIKMPSLRERPDDIPLLFRKFASDFSLHYGMAKVVLAPDAVALLKSYRWPGNIRQLKNVTESVSVLEGGRGSAGTDHVEISASALARYIPKDGDALPVIPVGTTEAGGISQGEKEALIRLIFQLRQEVETLREKVDGASLKSLPEPATGAPQQGSVIVPERAAAISEAALPEREEAEWQDSEGATDDLSIHRAGNELIRRALERNGGNRKAAASELGISERTLYRKIKEMLVVLLVATLSFCMASCGIYSFSGTSIQPDVKTIQVDYFEYKALKVNPLLANKMTEDLREKYRKLTRLEQVEEDGDLEVTGAITGYTVSTSSVTSDEKAAQNRLTVTVKLQFSNRKYPEDDFDKSFSAYADFDATQLLDSVQDALCEEIVSKLVEDIFNATVAQW